MSGIIITIVPDGRHFVERYSETLYNQLLRARVGGFFMSTVMVRYAGEVREAYVDCFRFWKRSNPNVAARKLREDYIAYREFPVEEAEVIRGPMVVVVPDASPKVSSMDYGGGPFCAHGKDIAERCKACEAEGNNGFTRAGELRP